MTWMRALPFAVVFASVLHKNDKEDLYCILGCWQTDAEGKPMFARTMAR